MGRIEEKIQQASSILEEVGVDLWLIFVRESATMPDPALDLVVGQHVTWQTAWMISRTGETIAIAGNLDVASIKDMGRYQEVISYREGIGDALRETLFRLDPGRIAINFSLDSVMADGLTYGMFLQLQKHLEGTPYADRLVSSAPILAALRGRKSSSEIERITKACEITTDIYHQVTGELQVGKTEKEIASFILGLVDDLGLGLAWERDHCPAVFTGPDHAGAHYGPTSRPIEAGHIINTDFGVKYQGYCSDLQRTWYVLKEGESEPPAAVQNGFKVLLAAIDAAFAVLRPGVESWKVDQAAREVIVKAGYPEYPHGLGHQVGRAAHDGGIGLFPKWERYGELPFGKVEVGQVFTIEPRLSVPGHGVVTMEEIVWVKEDETVYLSKPQRELYVVSG